MSQPFVHLHLHTEFSMVDSVVRVNPLMEAVASAGMPAVAMTDQSNLFALVKFYRAALARGLKPIIGAEVWLEHPAVPEPSKLVLLCKDIDGFRCLSRLVTRGYLEGQQNGVPVIHRAWLDTAGIDRLLALSGAREGAVGRLLLANRRSEARDIARDLRECFGGDFLSRGAAHGSAW
jgi:DNA polymerase-3 subunit alpha